MKLKIAVILAAALFSATEADAASADPKDAVELPTVSTEQLGAWMDSFPAATNYAFSTGTPLVMLWSNNTCDYCNAFKTSLKNSAFAAWQAEQPFVFCYVEADDGKESPPNVGAEKFTKNAGGNAKVNGYYPMVSLLWLDKGTVKAAAAFTGRPGKMGVSRKSDMYLEFIEAVETAFAAYTAVPDYLGGTLAFTNEYANSRFEAEAGFTKWVDIPLKREDAPVRFAATNTLTVVFGDTEVQREKVEWSEGEDAKYVHVSIPSGAKNGDEIAVTLLDDEGGARGSVRIFVAERENSTKNPLWLGERTAETLQFGEWTMDLDVAMEKYRADKDSKIVVIAAGSLWCPDCVMTDRHFIDTDAFYQWAVDNKVILVDLDVPNFPNTTGSACLLTRVATRLSDGYISARNTSTTNETERYQSGTVYLSRHMVTDEAAAEVFERNRHLVGMNTLDGGWNNPDRANQSRTGIPNFFTLNRDGVLAGTFETFDILGPKTDDRTDAYLARFTELIGMGDADGSDVLNRSWKTTGDTFSGTNETAATLSVLDYDDVYALDPTENFAEEQILTVVGEDSVSVTVSLIEVVDGTAKTLATANGTLSDGVSATGFISSTGGDYYVRVETPRADAETVSGAESTVAAYTLSGSRKAIDNPFANDWTARSVTTTLPVYSNGALAGTLALSLRRDASVSAVFHGGNSVRFSGKWDLSTVEANGRISLSLPSSDGASELTLVLKNDGSISAEIVADGEAVISGESRLGEDFSAFAGYYTVALIPADGNDGGYGFMTLETASPAAAKAGRFSCKVHLPDGSLVYGSSHVTWFDANFGVIPVRIAVGDGEFSAALKIRKDAASSKSPSPRAIVAVDGVSAVWRGGSRSRAFEREFDVRGSIYKEDASFVVLADFDAESGELKLSADASAVSESEAYGALEGVAADGCAVAVASDSLTLDAEGVKFAFNRKTGEFTGKTEMPFAGKPETRPVTTGVISGVVVPGWFSACGCSEDEDALIQRQDMPFGVGFCVFTDKTGKRSVKRDFPVALEAE